MALRTSLVAGGAAVLLLLSGLAFFYWQNGSLRSELRDMTQSHARVTEANAINAVAIERMREDEFWKSLTTVSAVKENDKLSAQLRVLQRELQEASRDQAVLDMLVDPRIARNLCVQWQAANSHGVPHDTADTPGNVDAGQAHTAPAVDCAPGRPVTVRDLVEWLPGLIEYAGHDKRDRAALREWAEKVGR